MEAITVKFKKLRPGAVLPRAMHRGDAGLDVCAAEDTRIAAGGFGLVPTGLAAELPEGTELQVRPRSGLALKHGVTLLNSPGTVDSNYRGEIGVILINHGKAEFLAEKGMRIAQLVAARVCPVAVEETEVLSETERNEKGFGSSGEK